MCARDRRGAGVRQKSNRLQEAATQGLPAVERKVTEHLRRKGYRRWRGYRARLTLLRISGIDLPDDLEQQIRGG